MIVGLVHNRWSANNDIENDRKSKMELSFQGENSRDILLVVKILMETVCREISELMENKTCENCLKNIGYGHCNDLVQCHVDILLI